MCRLITILSAVFITGCASVEVVKLSPDLLDSLAERQLTVVTYDKTDFSAFTSGKMMAASLFGAVGGAIAGASMVKAGNEVIEDNNIKDPALEIASTISPWVAEKLSSTPPNTISGHDTNVEDPGKLSALVGSGEGVVLDVKTTTWMYNYFASSFSRYQVTYRARVRLIDAGSGEIVGQVPCEYISPEKSDDAPTEEELLENGAVLLKEELKSAADACSRTVMENMLEA